MPWVVFWSVALLVSACGLTLAINGARFARLVAREARELRSTTAPAIDRAPLATLPPPVQRYLVAAGLIATPPLPGRGSVTVAH